MKLATRILILTLALAAAAFAQETTTTATSTTTTAPASTTAAEAAEEPSTAEGASNRKYELRSRFTRELHDHPYDLSMILKLDPALLTNEAFLVRYPDLQQFLQTNPEIQRNPRFYLAEISTPGSDSAIESVVEMLAVLGGFTLAVFAIFWLIRTVIEQRRWNRLSRTQAEVHNKILDRFGSSEEVLAYIQTAAGTKFLESAPIPLQAEKAAPPAPFARAFWSIQLGVVIAVAALGMLLVSFRFEGESAQGLFAMGAIAFSVGAGFIASAVVSIALSRRLGLWQGPPESNDLHDAGLVR